MKNEILPLGAIPCLRMLDAAVYRSIICNPNHGLTQEQFDEIAKAHAETLKQLWVIDNL